MFALRSATSDCFRDVDLAAQLYLAGSGSRLGPAGQSWCSLSVETRYLDHLRGVFMVCLWVIYDIRLCSRE